MDQHHVLSDGLFREALAEFAVGNHWIAYNSKTFFLDHADMWFFRDKEEAVEFADDNISDHDAFAVIHAASIASLLQQLPYGEHLSLDLSPAQLEQLFQSFDWHDTYYDPLQEALTGSIAADPAAVSRMEFLLEQWEALYHRDARAALELSRLYWDGRPMEYYKNDFITIKNDLMNENNFDYLKSNIRNHGFGETLAPALEAQLQQGVAEFTLAYKTEVNKREMEATLYFKKSETTDMYFFNKYDTRLKNEKDETLSQTFYINNGWGVTLKEAYNLLNGRAVHKELTNKDDQKYTAWIQLDFSAKDKHGNYERKQYHANYGYDLKETLAAYPIKEMGKEKDMEMLLKSLERGNVQQVTVQSPTGDVKVFIEANPQYKSVNLYDHQLKRLNQEQREALQQKPETGPSKDQQKAQSLDAEGQDGKKRGKEKVTRAAEPDNGLVKKHRQTGEGRGKGLR